MDDFKIQVLSASDRPWAAEVLTEHWGSPRIVTRGQVHAADRLPGYVAVEGTERLGLVTYHLTGDEGEIVSLNSLSEGRGIGSSLVEAVRSYAQRAGCVRLWLITTNDNLPALRFSQKRGFTLAALHPGAISASRRLKPDIPERGGFGIPVRDEIELEMPLRP